MRTDTIGNKDSILLEEFEGLLIIQSLDKILKIASDIDPAFCIHPTGSSYIYPHGIFSDIDLVIYINNNREDSNRFLETLCSTIPTTKICDSYFNEEEEIIQSFISCRPVKGLNIIIQMDRNRYSKFVYATNMAKMARISVKQDRVDFFNIIIASTSTIVPFTTIVNQDNVVREWTSSIVNEAIRRSRLVGRVETDQPTPILEVSR